MRYFLLDKVLDIEVGKCATGVKCVTLTDNILHDHFPDYPILPGALIIEGMAQLAGFLLETTYNKSNDHILRALLVQVDKMKFHHTTGPGDTLVYTVEIESTIDDFVKVKVAAKVGEKICTKGKITFQLVQIDSENVNAQRLNIYKIWTRELKNCPPLR